LFKSLPVAKNADRLETVSGAALGFERDSVTLGWEERLRTRARRRSEQGFEFGTALPRGTILYQDDCFVFDTERIIVRVVELEEAMLVVRPASDHEWGLYAYHIGNSHQPMMITGDAIVCPDTLGMDQILAYHAIPFLREQRRFTPIGQVADHQHQLSR
jgi:urease accessory protein UreE